MFGVRVWGVSKCTEKVTIENTFVWIHNAFLDDSDHFKEIPRVIHPIAL